MPGRRKTTTVGTRYVAAFGVSLGCHAMLLLALTLLPVWRVRIASERPLLVALVDAGADNGAGDSDARELRSAGAAASDADARAIVPESVAAHPRHKPVRRRVASADNARRTGHDGATRDATPSREITAALAVLPGAADASAPERGGIETATGAATDAAAANAANGAAPAGAAIAASGGALSGLRGGAASDVGGGVGAAAATGRGGGDLRPWCSVCPTPVYPARARREGWQGTVDVDLRVGRDGAVEQASIGRSSGFAVLDAAAVTVARLSRFRIADGAERHGQLRYRFVLEGPAERPL